jgi:hypothetical protein
MKQDLLPFLVVVVMFRDASPWVESDTGGLVPSMTMVPVFGVYKKVPATYTGRQLQPSQQVSRSDV